MVKYIGSSVALEAWNSVAEAPKSGTPIGMGSLTYPSRVQYAMHCWQTVSLRSITGLPTQAGPHFACAMKMNKTSAVPSGLCGRHTSATHLRRQLIRRNSLSRRAKNCA